MKLTAELTPLQLDVWHGTLGIFPKEIINAAVLEIALTDIRFPELGDLYQACRSRAIKASLIKESYNPNGSSSKPEISSQEIRDIAARLELKVPQPKPQIP